MLGLQKFYKILSIFLFGAWIAATSVLIIAAPQGGEIKSGDITISNDPSSGIDTLVTQTTEKGIIDWQSFNIDSGEHTHFKQPNINAITLNRVIGGDVSAILGKLTATGRILLINPSGILFGPSSYVDVSGLLATTADIRNEDFLNDNYYFIQGPNGEARIINQGYIKIADKGMGFLVAPRVENYGVIEAVLGKVVLGSAPAESSYVIDFYGDQLLQFALSSETASSIGTAINQAGKIIAPGGEVFITADTAKSVVDQSINMSGIIEANTISNQHGTIILSGGDKGIVNVTGKISAKGNDLGEIGGTVKIQGEKISLSQGAIIDVSGMAGGGDILIGADYLEGKITPNSKAVYIAPDAYLYANALDLGSGGNILIWSDDATLFYGKAEARGGVRGGDGGLVETSSKNFIDIYGAKVDVSSPLGITGTWLLDPYNVDIVDALSSNGAWTYDIADIWVPSSNNSKVYVEDILANLATANVEINTGVSGVQDGDITLSTDLLYTGVTESTLSLIAANDIIINALVEGSNLNLILDTVGGVISINNEVAVKSLTTQGGTTYIGANSISTIDSQIYNNPVSLGVNAILTASGNAGDISFLSTLSGGGYNLVLNTGRDITFNDSIESLRSLTVNANMANVGGEINLAGGLISTERAQQYNAPIMLGSDNLLITSANTGDIEFTQIIDGVYGLTLNAARDAIFGGDVGGSISLNSLSVVADNIYLDGITINTYGTQLYNNPVILNGDVILRTGDPAANIEFADIVYGANGLTAKSGNKIIFYNNVGEGGALSHLDLTALNAIEFFGGEITTSGSQQYTGPVILNYDARIAGGDIDFNSTIDGNAGLEIDSTGSVSFNNGAIGESIPLTYLLVDVVGNIVFNTPLIQTVGVQRYYDPVRLGANVVLATSGSGGDITFNSTVDGGYSLTINSGNGVSFTGPIGSITSLGSLDISGDAGITIAADSVTTIGDQVYNDDVTLSGANDKSFVAAYGALSFLSGLSGSGQNVDLDSNSYETILTNADHLNNLTISGIGNKQLLGVLKDLTSLSVSTGGITTLNTDITTSGNQTYFGAVDVVGDTSLAGDNIVFNDVISGDHGLTIDAASNTTLADGINGLDYLDVNSSVATNINTNTIATSGEQNYTGDVVLGAISPITFSADGSIIFNDLLGGSGQDVVLNAASGSVELHQVSDLGDLQLLGGSNKYLLGAFNRVVSLDSNGGTIYLGTPSIATSHLQTYSSAVKLLNDVSLSSSNIVFRNTINDTSGYGLTIDSLREATFNEAVGGGNALSYLTVNASDGINLNASITTTGAQQYNDNITLGSDITLVTTNAGGDINFAKDIEGFNGLVVDSSGGVSFAAPLDGEIKLNFLDISGDAGIAIATDSMTTIGDQVYNGDVFLGTTGPVTFSTNGYSLTFNDALTGGGQDVDLNAGLGSIELHQVSNLGDLQLSGGGDKWLSGIISNTASLNIANGITYIGAPTITTAGAQIYSGAINLLNDVNVSGSDISFINTINDTSGYGLTVNGSGVVAFWDKIGNDDALSYLTVNATNGGINLNAPTITTSGTQQYNGAVTLGANTLFTTTGSGSDINFAGALDSASSDNYGLTVDAQNDIRFSGNVGESTPLGYLDLSSQNIYIDSNLVNTIGSQNYHTGVMIASSGPVTISAENGSIKFFDSLAGNNQSINIKANSTDTELRAVSNINQLTLLGGGDKKITGAFTNVGSFKVLDGTTYISIPDITTASLQSYGGGVEFLNDLLLNGEDIVFGSTINGGFNLGINSSGEVTFGGSLGAITPLRSLVVDASDGINLDGRVINTVMTQAYNAPITLGADNVLTTIDSTSGDISFNSTIDGAYDLTVNTAGDVEFGDAIGLSNAIDQLAVDADGKINLAGSDIVSIDDQEYKSPVVLNDDVTLTTTTSAGDVIFADTINGANGLSVNAAGSVTFDGVIGGVNPLTYLKVGALGSINLNIADITTIGQQFYNGNIVLSNDMLFTTTGDDSKIEFNGAIDGSYGVTIDATGNVIFGGPIGLVSALDNLIVYTPGSIYLSGGSINTVNTQYYQAPVLLGADATLTSKDVAFATTLDSDSQTTPRSLVINASDDTIFNDKVGGTNPLASITTDSSGTTHFFGIGATTTGSQTYNDPVLLHRNVLLGAGSDINFGSTITGPYNLILEAGGNIGFNGSVGTYNDPIGAMYIINANDVTADGAIYVTAFLQGAGTGTTMFNNLLFVGAMGGGAVYIPGTGTGDAIINTNVTRGIIDVGSLYLNVRKAYLTGYVGGVSAIYAIDHIGLLNSIVPGTHFFDAIDLFGLAASAVLDDGLAQSIMNSLLSNYNFGFGYEFFNMGDSEFDYLLLLDPLECEVVDT